MSEKKVIVLMSTYNGEEFVGEQIDSILNQTYPNIEIHVRDDGSKDGTLKILQKYEEEGRIVLEKGRNVGFIKSFFWLVKHCPPADYYAFSDQDDVWEKQKIAAAVKRLEKEEAEIPLLYFSNYDFYDKDMNYVGAGDPKMKHPTFANCLLDCMSLGISIVYNRSAEELMRKHIPKHSCGHDWWTYMVCQGMGKVIYDRRSMVRYRRHGNNVSAGGMDFLRFQIWRFKKFFLNHYFKNIHLQLKEYEKLYGKQLKPHDRELLALFTEDRYQLKNVWRKAFWREKYRQSFLDEVFVRIIILIGKL